VGKERKAKKKKTKITKHIKKVKNILFFLSPNRPKKKMISDIMSFNEPLALAVESRTREPLAWFPDCGAQPRVLVLADPVAPQVRSVGEDGEEQEEEQEGEGMVALVRLPLVTFSFFFFPFFLSSFLPFSFLPFSFPSFSSFFLFILFHFFSFFFLSPSLFYYNPNFLQKTNFNPNAKKEKSFFSL
jgi:hypothetical protein